ncbi:MAG: flippase [Eubacteriales bacterium]|nr:flippase [Eubacteriales bacterium]
MGKATVKRNYLYNLAYQLLVILTPLVTTPYISRVIGEKGIGAFSWTQSICTYFVLVASLGISMYGQREIAYHQDSREERSRIFEELLIFRGIMVTASLLVYFALFVFQDRYSDLFLIQSLDVVAVIFDISWLMQGMEDFKRVVGRNALVKCLSVLCIFLFVKDAGDLPIYALCLSGSSFLGNLSLWIYVPKYVSYVPIKKLHIRRHIAPTLYLFLPQVAIQVYAVMDKTMLGSLNADIAQNGFYTQAQKIIKVSLAVVTSMGNVMLPRVSYIFATKGKEEVRRTILGAFRFSTFMGCGIMFGIIGIAKGLVPWFYGEGYEPIVQILYCLSPTILLIATSNVSGMQCLVPMKKQKAFNTSVILGAVCNLIINALLIPDYGAIGASIGTVAAEFTVLAIQLFSLRSFAPIGKILAGIGKNSLAGLVMLAVLLYTGTYLPSSILSTLLEIALGFAVYCIVLLLMRDQMVKEILDKGVGLIRRKLGNTL